MEIIVLQHIKIEDPGHIKDLMIKDGINLTTIELDEGEKIPNDLNKFDAMFCMGGPMDTWMDQEFPWLIEEKNKIKEFVVNLEKPYLGNFNIGFMIFNYENIYYLKNYNKIENYLMKMCSLNNVNEYIHNGYHVTFNSISELEKAKENMKKFYA